MSTSTLQSGDRILVTGAAGFIGVRVVRNLLERGFTNLLCLVRPSSNLSELECVLASKPHHATVEVITGNLISRDVCSAACGGARLIFHLAAGTGEKSFPDAYMNSVVATRNLLDAVVEQGSLYRFVLVSSFAVYSNRQKQALLDETCPVEDHPELRDAYCYAKVKQEEIVGEYAAKCGVPAVVLRPGSVYGPGRKFITGRVGLGTFGVFLHLGGRNRIPFTYVDNCAEAIVLAGLARDVDGEVFNIVDDDLPSSRVFLRNYKQQVEHFRSVYVPGRLSYTLCALWEKYTKWSQNQLPPVFTTRRWYAEWRSTRFSNEKLKMRLGWEQKIATAEAMQRFFTAARGARHA